MTHDPTIAAVPARAPVGRGLVALWVLMLLNLAWFVPFAVSTGSGIVQALIRAAQAPPAAGGADAGGVQWMLLNVVGVLVLGIALVYGLNRYRTRDRGPDPAGEAAADQYNRPNTGAD